MPTKDKFDNDWFWGLIEKTKQLSGNDYNIQCRLLEDSLIEGAIDIADFNKEFWKRLSEAYDWKVWAAAYIINGGCSDDCFMDFRSWLIAQGKEIFYEVIKDPEELLDLNIEPDAWEGIQYAADNAYYRKTGNHLPVTQLDLKKEPSGNRWEEGDLPQLLPVLYKKYMESE